MLTKTTKRIGKGTPRPMILTWCREGCMTRAVYLKNRTNARGGIRQMKNAVC